jgi:hypothetical protein
VVQARLDTGVLRAESYIMDISSIGGNGPIRSHSAALQNASPAGVGATSSEAVTKANLAEVAAQKPLPVLGAPDVERDEDKKQTSESVSSRNELTPEEKDIVEHLKQVDREVRAHEQAHLSAAGAYATGGASFQFTTGPDGSAYAVAGEVGIDASSERTPEATIQKMQVVRAAALAPADPSPQDMAVAAAAGATESAARSALAKQQVAEMDQKSDESAQRLEASEAASKEPVDTLRPLGSGAVEAPVMETEREPAIIPPGVVPPGSGDRVSFEALPVLGQGEPLSGEGISVADRLMERNNVAPFVTEKSASPLEIASRSYERGAKLDDESKVDVVA